MAQPVDRARDSLRAMLSIERVTRPRQLRDFLSVADGLNAGDPHRRRSGGRRRHGQQRRLRPPL